MKMKFLTLSAILSLIVAGVFAAFAVTGQATADAADEMEWDIVGGEFSAEVEFETEDGYFEFKFENFFFNDVTSPTTDICMPLPVGYICEDEVEVDAEDMSIDFQFPHGVSTARLETFVEGCGVIDVEIVLPPMLGYETFEETEFSPDDEMIAQSRGVAIFTEAIFGENLTGVICDIELNSDNVFEAEISMEKSEFREQFEEEDEEE